MDIRILCLVLILLIVFINRSNFTNVYKCNKDERLFPEGNIPGEYLGLNKYEKDELARRFVTPEDEKIIIEKYINNFN